MHPRTRLQCDRREEASGGVAPRRRSRCARRLALLFFCFATLWQGASQAEAGTNVWTQIALGGARIHDLQFSADGTELWAATGGSGVFKSSNGGQTWTHASGSLAALQFLALAQSPSSSTTWIATTADDVWATSNSGASWSSLLSSDDAAALAATKFNATSTTTLYAATTESLFKSTNGGSTWSLADSGIEDENLRSVAPSPHNSSHLWVCGSGGPYLSTNNASSFTLKASGLDVLPHPICTALAYHPSSSSKLYLGTWWGMFRSTDTGATWSRLDRCTRGDGQPFCRCQRFAGRHVRRNRRRAVPSLHQR